MWNEKILRSIAVVTNSLALIFFIVVWFVDDNVVHIIQISGWSLLIITFLIQMIIYVVKGNSKNIGYSYPTSDGGYRLLKDFFFAKEIQHNNIFYTKNEEFTSDICNYETFKNWCTKGIIKAK